MHTLKFGMHSFGLMRFCATLFSVLEFHQAYDSPGQFMQAQKAEAANARFGKAF